MIRKAGSEDDAFDDVSGTLGLTGAADTIIVMKRHAGAVKIYVRGRDIEEAEFAAKFNKDSCRWRLMGEADEVFRSAQRQAIATVLKKTNQPMSAPEIMAATERRDRHATEMLLHKMERNGEVKHAGRGLWAHPDHLKSVEIGEIGKKTRGNGGQTFDKDKENGTAESQRQSQRNLNASKTVEISVEIPKSDTPLRTNGKSDESQHLNDHNGPERVSHFRPPLCDNCGRPATTGQRWDWEGRPLVLHSSCEGPWFESGGRPHA